MHCPIIDTFSLIPISPYHRPPVPSAQEESGSTGPSSGSNVHDYCRPAFAVLELAGIFILRFIYLDRYSRFPNGHELTE